jgi:hypothetical protein
MPHLVLVSILILISALVLFCAVRLNLRNSPSIPVAVETVMFDCVVVIILAILLKILGILVVFSWTDGIKFTLDIIGNSFTDSVFAYLWDVVRFIPVGSFVAFADASAQVRNKKFIRCSLAAGITAATIQMLVLPDGEQPILMVLLACAIGSPIIGLVIASTSSFPRNVVITRFATRLITRVRVYPKMTVIVLAVVVLVVFQFVHRTSRVFLTLSDWREASVNYSEITATKGSPVTSTLLKLFDYLPVGAAGTTKWLYFKSGKIKLDFFSIGSGRKPNKGPSGQQLEMAVSRVDGDLFFGDEFLDQLFTKRSDFKPELVYRGKVPAGAFNIEAPQFVCSVYDAIDKMTGSLEVVITTGFRKTVEVSKINAIPLVAGMKNATASSDWINVRAPEGILGFTASAKKGVAMFCRASRNSSNIPPFYIRISSQGLANPIVIGENGGSSRSQARRFGSLPGFIVEMRSDEGGVSIGNFNVGSNSIALGGANFRFLPGRLSKIVARYPRGKMKIDADNIINLDIMDEVALEHSELELSYLTRDEVAVQGESKDVAINGRSLSKPLLPDAVKESISQVISWIK